MTKKVEVNLKFEVGDPVWYKKTDYEKGKGYMYGIIDSYDHLEYDESTKKFTATYRIDSYSDRYFVRRHEKELLTTEEFERTMAHMKEYMAEKRQQTGEAYK